jgi:acetyl-CoA carboxylase/biotin carboxylase 1
MDWSGTGVDETILSEDGYVTVADDVYQKACVHSAEDGLLKTRKIGYPVMIKASEGGGGKGIRKVEKEEDFKQAFGAVLTEVPGKFRLTSTSRWETGKLTLFPLLFR